MNTSLIFGGSPVVVGVKIKSTSSNALIKSSAIKCLILADLRK